MTSQSSGGSGSGLPGVTGDGLNPGGVHIAGEETVVGAITGASVAVGSAVVAGRFTCGDSTAVTTPSYQNLNGATFIGDSPANSVDADATLEIDQTAVVSDVSALQALWVRRHGDISSHDYSKPAFTVWDGTASTQPLATFERGVTAQFQVDSDGVQVHGKVKVGSSVTHTASVLSGKCVPIYDEAGTLLGYMPLYN